MVYYNELKNAILKLLSPSTTHSLEPQSCIVVEDPLHVVGDLDEDTGLAAATDCAEDDDPAQVVVTALRLTGERRPSVQSEEAGGLVGFAVLTLGTDDV